MKKFGILLFVCIAFFSTQLFAQKKYKKLKQEEVTYTSADGTTLRGFIAYPISTQKLKTVIIVHEWWGSNEYVRMRARKLAALGYFTFAVDIYGTGKTADNPKDAGALATPFYKDPQLAKGRIEAALEKLKDYPNANADNAAAIGYCFGGSMVLNAAKLGMNFKGVVSFHGGLAGVPATANGTKAKILVCHGAADKFISAEELSGFRNNLDSVKANYQFIAYPDATHAFTNEGSTAVGLKFGIPIAYNKAADQKSWKDMLAFFKQIF